jgi:hypothetical protein
MTLAKRDARIELLWKHQPATQKRLHAIADQMAKATEKMVLTQTKKEWYVRQLEIALADVLAIGKQLEELHGLEPIWKK